MVGLALRVGVEETVHLALVTLHDAVLGPTYIVRGRGRWGVRGGRRIDVVKSVHT